MFKPGTMVSAISIDGLNAAEVATEVLANGAFVPGYSRAQATRQEFDVEGVVAYYTYERNDRLRSTISVPNLCGASMSTAHAFSFTDAKEATMRPQTPSCVMEFPLSDNSDAGSNSEEATDEEM